MDTPGFDDSDHRDGEILTQITRFLGAKHALGIPLKGVLYFHKIIDNRMTGSAARYLEFLESLVGEEAMPNTILVTAMWNLLRDENYGDALRREQELIDTYWEPLQEKGSFAAQFDGTPESAHSLIWQLAGMKSVVLQVQRELIKDEKTVAETTAGARLVLRLEYRGKLANLASKSRWKERARVQAKKGHIEKSMAAMKSEQRSGRRIKDRVKEVMSKPDAQRALVTALALIVNITLYIVQALA